MTLKELLDGLQDLPTSTLRLEVMVWTRGGAYPLLDVRVEGDKYPVVVLDGTEPRPEKPTKKRSAKR